MKKIAVVFLLAFTLFSCSSNEDSNVDSDLLQRVDFFPGKSNETRWYFNSSGLLSKIKTADGTLVEEFVYDSKNNVIHDIKHSENGDVLSIDATYNADGIITSIGGKNYIYDPANNRYTYNDETIHMSCDLNIDMLAVNYSIENTVSEQGSETVYKMNYDNGNMVSFHKKSDDQEDNVRNFSYNGNDNPLRKATLAVLKLKSLIEPEFLAEGISSNSLFDSLNFGNDNATNYSYGMLIYPNNNVELQDRQIFDGKIFVESYTYARYYYQGQTIP